MDYRGFRGSLNDLNDSASKDDELLNLMVNFFNVKNYSAAKSLIQEERLKLNNQTLKQSNVIFKDGDILTMGKQSLFLKDKRKVYYGTKH